VRLGPTGTVLASGEEQNGSLRLHVNTRLLRTNHVSRPAVIYGTGQQTKSKFFKLKVDNTPPRLLSLRTHSSGSGHLVSFRLSEKSKMRIAGGGTRYAHWIVVARHKLITATLPGSVRHARLLVRDRAGNTVRRNLAW
jgi:hypothetical protein